MVLNLVSDESGLDISFISYNVTFVDRCAQYTVTIKYKNLSSLPLPLKFKNDNRDLGILIELKSTIGAENLGAFKIENSNLTSIEYPLLKSYGIASTNSSGNNSPQQIINTDEDSKNINIEELIKSMSINQDDIHTSKIQIIDLMPGKEITMVSKYLKELTTTKKGKGSQDGEESEASPTSEETISICIPKHTSITSPFPPIKIDIKIDGEVSKPLDSSVCPSHPSSISSLTLCENIINSKHDLSSNHLLTSDFVLLIGLESELHHSGWITCTLSSPSSTSSSSSSSPPLSPISITSSLVNLNQTTPPQVDKVLFNNVEHTLNNNTNQTIIYSMEYNSSSTSPTTNTTTKNNNVILKYNNNKEFNVTLKTPKLVSSSIILNKFSSISKIQQLGNNNDNNNNNIDICTLLSLIFTPSMITTANSSPSTTTNNITSPLSQSSPPINSNNNKDISMNDQTNARLQRSGELLSNILANLPNKAKLVGANQSLTAPPSVGKDLSNPIADFIASRGGSGGSGLNKPKTKKGPPPKLGSNSTGSGSIGGNGSADISSESSDVRVSRLASYNRVNQLWNVSSSDFAQRVSITMRELEPYALDYALAHIKTKWWKRNRIATIDEIKALRLIISSIINSPKINLTFVEPQTQRLDTDASESANSPSYTSSPLLTSSSTPTSPPLLSSTSKSSFSDLKNLLQQQSPQSQSLPSIPSSINNNNTATITTTTATSTKTPSDIILNSENSEVDPVKLRWIVEEVLNGEQSTFQSLEEDKSSSPPMNWFSVSLCETKGGRPHMEDNHILIEYPYDFYGLDSKCKSNSNDSSSNNNCNIAAEQFFFGVFDGHNGKIAAEYCRINLPYEIYSDLSSNSNNSNIGEEVRYLESIKNGYLNTDKNFLKYAELDNKKAGTTVATVLLERGRLIVSNAGDSEIILCTNNKAIPLTTVHTPKLDSERERIEANGGSIIHYGTLRVNGLLSVSRSIGDKNLKDLIIPDPDSCVHHLVSPADQFLVLATDGLWEVFEYQDLVNNVITLMENPEIENENISSIIIDEALKRNSKDNITLIIIFFNN